MTKSNRFSSEQEIWITIIIERNILSSKISRSSFFQFGPSSDFQDSIIQLQFPKYFSFVLQAMHSSMQQFIYVTSQVLATPSITHTQPSIVSLPPLTRPFNALSDPLSQTTIPLPSSHLPPPFTSLPSPFNSIHSTQSAPLQFFQLTKFNPPLQPTFSQVTQQAHRQNLEYWRRSGPGRSGPNPDGPRSTVPHGPNGPIQGGPNSKKPNPSHRWPPGAGPPRDGPVRSTVRSGPIFFL
jgi:hypothetical protein